MSYSDSEIYTKEKKYPPNYLEEVQEEQEEKAFNREMEVKLHRQSQQQKFLDRTDNNAKL